MDISQFELENLLSIRVFKSHGDTLGYRRFAWNTLIDHLWKIMPVGMCDRVNRSQLMALGFGSLCLPLRNLLRPAKFLMSVIFPLEFRPLRPRRPSPPLFSKALPPS